MRIYISIDMEGVAGITDRRQVHRGNDDYEHARTLMAGEANAVTAAAFDAGAETVVVNDAHGDLCNLRPGDIDERARLQIGSGKMPHGMIFGADSGIDAALFIGYHAMAGTAGGVLEHSYSSAIVAGIRVNGQDWGEAELNAAILGAHGIPVALVSGDDLLCEQIAKTLPEVTTVVVKDGLGYRAARSMSPAAARAALADATRRALSEPLPAPFRPATPYHIEVDFLTTAMAEAAALVPGARRAGPRAVAAQSTSIDEIGRYRSVFTVLAGTALGI
jgi:D-amino peptidase